VVTAAPKAIVVIVVVEAVVIIEIWVAADEEAMAVMMAMTVAVPVLEMAAVCEAHLR
jgi:hypothetical protein